MLALVGFRDGSSDGARDGNTDGLIDTVTVGKIEGTMDMEGIKLGKRDGIRELVGVFV